MRIIRYLTFTKILSGFSLLLVLAPSIVLAGGETPVSEGLRYITNALYGATGVTIATISVMIVGVLCLIHLLRWTALAYTIIGMSLIFGAGSVVNGITSLVHNY